MSAPSQVAAEQEHAGTFGVPAYKSADATQHANVGGAADGVSKPKLARERSQSRVRWNLAANESISPEESRKENEERTDESESTGERKHRRRHRRDEERLRGGEGHRDSPGLMHDKYESDSEGTVELPQRFDEHGNKKTDGDPLADGINKLLGGSGLADLLGRLGGGGQDDDDTSRGSRRRHRH